MTGFKCLLLLSLWVALWCQLEAKMLYAFTLARHGAVYPPNDLYDGNETKQYRGLLTPVGLRQHYNLGTYLQHDYITLANLTTPTFNPNHLEFYATSKSRTQNSALAFIYGLYPLGLGWTIPKAVPTDKLNPPYTPLFPDHLSQMSEEGQFALNKGFQPLPVRPADSVLDNCPNYDYLLAERLDAISSTVADFEKQRRSLISRMSLLFRLVSVKVTLQTMSDLYDTVYADLNLGRPMPSDFNQQDKKNLKYMYQFYNALIFDGTFARVLATPSLRMLRIRLQGAVGTSQLKLTYLFGHHSNVLPLITTMNLTSAECLTQKYKDQPVTALNCVQPPRYAASLIVELHQNDASQHVIKVKYNGYYVNLCQRNNTECALQQFVQRLQHSQANFEQQCKVHTKAPLVVEQ